jgi:hypothetical protein
MAFAPRHPVLAALLALVVHFVVTVVLAVTLINAAYTFGSPNSISGVDQLYRLGDSPRFGFYGLALSGFLDFVTMAVLLAPERTRPWAWTAAIWFIVLSILIVIAAISRFQMPAPQLGG